MPQRPARRHVIDVVPHSTSAVLNAQLLHLDVCHASGHIEAFEGGLANGGLLRVR